MAIAGAALAAAVPLHLWICRVSRAGLRFRAPLDTFMHGFTPAMALSPLWLSGGELRPGRGLFIFLCGFLLDLDHVIAFRSLSIEKCSTQERRPFGHSLTFALGSSAAVGAIFGGFAAGALCFYALLTHILFDATDFSGIPAFYPAPPILRRVPLDFYAGLLAAGVVAAALLAREGAVL